MYSRNTIFPILFILFMVLYTTNSFVIDFQENISDEDKTSLTVRENAVVLDSLVGDTNVTIPEMLDNARRKNTQNGKKLFRKLTSFGRSNNRRIRSNEYKSSIECRDEALRISTGINEINRNWEVFFLRNTLRNTNDVWFCCYVMEYMASLSTKISEKCNSQLDVRHFVLRTDEEIRACQMFEFNSLECFFVRWTYYWIPVLTLLLIVLGLLIICCTMKCRRSRAYQRARQREENRTTTSLRNGI